MFNELVWKGGEKKTVEFMEKRGFKVVKTNFSCVGVELDVISILPKAVQKKNLKIQLKKLLKRSDRKEKKDAQNQLQNPNETS